MNEDEQLREALLELEMLRGREAERLRETSALLSALEALNSSNDIDAGIHALLGSIKTGLQCELVVLFSEEGGVLSEITTSAASVVPQKWSAPGLATRMRRIVDLTKVPGLWDGLPVPLEEMRSLLSVPFGEDSERIVLAAFSRTRGKFTTADADLLERTAAVASQAIVRKNLESRNSYLASVIDRSPVSVAIAEASEAMPLIYVNDSFVALTGYERDEILGQNCRFLSAEATDSQVRTEIRKTVADKASGTFLLRNKRKSGEIFWNELRLFPIQSSGGETTHLVATQTDSTQRVQAEIDRDEARRRLEGALTATTEAFLVIGRNGKVLFANAAFQSFLKPDLAVRDEELSKQAVALLVGQKPLDSDRSTNAFAAEINREVTAADGRQFLVRARPLEDDGAVISASDITQVKVNARILQQRLAAIERSQDGVAIGDAEGRLIDVNPSLLALWNCDSEADAVGRKWTKFYDAASVEAFAANEAWLQRTGAWRGEAERTVDGRMIVHDVSLSLVPDVGSVLIVRDITERRRLTEERSEMQRRLDRAQLQERLHQVSAGLAHDFNNLLSAILGSASLIESTEALEPAARDAVKRIQLAANRAAELTDGFLDLGTREKTAERIELGEILRNTVDLARGSAPRGVRLSASLAETPLVIEASQTDILQVVMNLVVNGIDAHEGMPGEVRVSVRRGEPNLEDDRLVVGTFEDRAYAAIVVEDAGAGMTNDTIDRLLEPYFTTKGNRGTGLGLSIVASIIADNDALLTVDTQPDRGTKFTVWWPLPVAQPDLTRKRTAKISARTNSPILILDDVPDVAAAIASHLSSEGLEVAETDDPAVTLETIEEDPDAWACLITDYDMPGMTGGDLIEALAQVAPDLPIIVVSALARRLTDRRLSGAVAVLQKPVNKDKLLEAVRTATQMPNEGDD